MAKEIGRMRDLYHIALSIAGLALSVLVLLLILSVIDLTDGLIVWMFLLISLVLANKKWDWE